MEFDYTRDTKEHYKDDDVALRYHEAFASSRSWAGLRFRIQAAGERRIISEFIHRVPADRLLDIPAGTGKLAPVLARGRFKVTAADVSANMLRLAEGEYRRFGLEDVKCEICDAEKVSGTLQSRFDLTICLRLLHRVPEDVKARILREISLMSPYAIVSLGLESPWNDLRHRIRNLLFTGRANLGERYLLLSRSSALRLLRENYKVLAARRVLFGLSEEAIFLLESQNSLAGEDKADKS